MGLKVKMLTLGFVSTNCFIIGDEDTKEAIVIDPADDAFAIMDVVEANDWSVQRILATHAHFDHVLAVGDLKVATGAPFLMHRDDMPLLQSVPQVVRQYGFEASPVPAPDDFLQEGDKIEVSGIQLEVLFTPGHAPGHITFASNMDILFSGDCLFQGSIGRTDLPGANFQQLMDSIENKLLPFDDEITVASGHGPLTTIGAEKKSNPFVLEWLKQK